LWNIILSHRQPAQLLPFLPAGKSLGLLGDAKANGIIYSPNEELGPLGKQLLDLGREYREWAIDRESDEVDPPSPGAELTSNDITKRELLTRHQVEMSRVKNRLLLDVLRTDGVHSVELWSVAFKMMVVARALLLEGDDRPAPRTDGSVEQEHPTTEVQPFPFAPGRGNFAEEFPTIQAALHARKTGAVAIPIGNPPRALKVIGHSELKMGTSRHTYRGYGGPGATSNKKINKTLKKVTGRFGLPMNLWRIIITYAMDVSDVLDTQQQMQVIRYACDWQSIKQELRIKGGTEQEQLWKILSSMDCLTYRGL
jgi:hypothetical protein